MKVGIVGAGVMGRGIALAALQARHSVILVDARTEAAKQAVSWISQQLQKSVEKGKLTEKDAVSAANAVSTCSDVKGLEHCELVIEAIVERYDAKVALFTELENIISADTVLATNTSSIAIAAIAKELQHPERFIGLHFFNPAHIMKLVEVIRCRHTTDAVHTVAVQFAQGLGKTAVSASDTPGFIVNRIARNFYNEAQRIVTEGAATIDQVDASIRGLGFKMGPFELMDLIGTSTNLDVTVSQWQQFYYEPRFQPSVLQKHTVDAGLKFHATRKDKE